MLLRNLIDPYIASRNRKRPIGRNLSDNTRTYLFNCVKNYESWRQSEPSIEHLAPEYLNEYLELSLAEGDAPHSVHTRRTGLLILLRYARRQKLVKYSARDVRLVELPELDNEGYVPEQMESLVEYMSKLRGTIRGTGIPANLFWPALALTEWNIGLRIGDFSRTPITAFNPQGKLFAAEQKTGKKTWQQLFPATTEAIARCIAVSPRRLLIWPGMKPASLCRAFTRHARRAGLPGTSQWIRRGASSAVEQANPGHGWRFLRHSSPKVFDVHYRVKAICDLTAPKPPEIRLTG